jgi:hypothetical protein
MFQAVPDLIFLNQTSSENRGGEAYQIMDLPETVTPQRELVRHDAHAVFSSGPEVITSLKPKTTTYESNANFLGCGCSGAAYGTTISANDNRYSTGRTSPWSLYVIVERARPSRWLKPTGGSVKYMRKQSVRNVWDDNVDEE